MKNLKIEKFIVLENPEFEGARALFTMSDRMKRFIAGLLEEFMEGQADRERVFYDEAAQKFGFADYSELEASGRLLQIDLTTRQIKLFKRND